MKRQARAIHTHRLLLTAAAEVFDERGFGAATIQEILSRAGVTKGALYFHFSSKEDLALRVLAAQVDAAPLPRQRTRVQELVDDGLLFAHRLRTDPLIRASVGLAMDQWSEGFDRREPFLVWIARLRDRLEAAREDAELLPHADPEEVAELLAGAFSGIQELSHVLSDRADLHDRVVVLLRHVLPSVVRPAVLVTLDFAADRVDRLLRQ